MRNEDKIGRILRAGYRKGEKMNKISESKRFGLRLG